MTTATSTGELPLPLRRVHSGKVRDLYELPDDRLLLVASDRLSAFDVVLPTPVPDKGAVLTGLSLWWFDQLVDVAPHHVLSAQLPEELAPVQGRALVVRRLEMLPVECVARGYLAGSGWADYRRTGSVSGVPLPPGLVEGDRLPEPVFTPSTKAPPGEHDRPMTYDEVVAAVGAELAGRLRDTTLEIYRRAAALAERAGILLADTKIELGLDASGTLTLGDEVLTPDSSRFWPADGWRPGGPQPSYDKQYVRDWLDAAGWDRTPPGPTLPPDVVAATRERYVTAYERLTGRSFADYLRAA